MPASLEHAVRIADDVVFRELDGEAIILNLESGVYFGLDTVGTRIWQLCQERVYLGTVWEMMCAEFDAPPDAMRADLLALIDELTSKGLLAIQR